MPKSKIKLYLNIGMAYQYYEAIVEVDDDMTEEEIAEFARDHIFKVSYSWIDWDVQEDEEKNKAYSSEDPRFCLFDEDGTHCDCFWDGEIQHCCNCGMN